MPIKFKNEAEMRKWGCKLDPNDPSTAVPTVRLPEPQPDDTWPDDTWADEQLIGYGLAALGVSDKLLAQSIHLSRKSTVQVYRAGHAFHLLRGRKTLVGDWCIFQKEHNLPRTNVWEAAELYERATKQGHGEEEIAKLSRTEAKEKYGIIKERKKKLNAGNSDSAGNETVGDSSGGQKKTSVAAGRAKADPQAAEAGEPLVEAKAPSVPSVEHTAENNMHEGGRLTAEEIDAASVFIESVGEWEHAIRVLVLRRGDGEIKHALIGMIETARLQMEWAEICETVIALKVREHGVEAIPV